QSAVLRAVPPVAAVEDREVSGRRTRRGVVVLGRADGETGVSHVDALLGVVTPDVVLHDVAAALDGRRTVLVTDGRLRMHRGRRHNSRGTGEEETGGHGADRSSHGAPWSVGGAWRLNGSLPPPSVWERSHGLWSRI